MIYVCRPLEMFERKTMPEPNSGCWIWLGKLHESGYGIFSIYGKQTRVHVFAYRTFKGPIPEDLFVLHSCDVRCCVNPDHLHLGTKKENTHECIARDRFQRGERHSNAKLTNTQILAIRRDPRVQQIIADELGISQTTISLIKSKTIWKHIK